MPHTVVDTSKVSFLVITDAHAGQRVDNFLITALKGAPKPLIYRIIRKGEVRVNKGRVKADSRLALGDEVRIPPIRLPEKGEIPNVSITLQQHLEKAIVYEDASLLAINKPNGLAVHGGSGVSLGLIEALRQIRPDHGFLELVHRLDRDTSGIILVAKKRSMLTALQRMLVNQSGITKYYLALVHGYWPREVQEIRAPLKRFERQSGERMVMVDDDGKASYTRIKWLAQGGHYSLIRAEPVSGRTHQIRVHCQYQGMSIAGDEKYCDKIQQGIDRQHGIKRLMLHAYQLSFRHPETGESLVLSAPLEQEFAKIVEQEGCHAQL